jgi:alpha-1,6-mannosyltransferase
MTLTPSRRLYLLGGVLLVALTVGSRHFSSPGEPSFIIPMAVAGIAYLFAIREFFCVPSFPTRVIVIGLALAAVWHLLFLFKPPGSDDDIHRYIWDGRVQRLGYDPYTAVPSDPALARLHTPETRTLNNPDLPSPYPPGAELFFRAITAIHESAFALKVAFVICDWTIVLVLLDTLRRIRLGEHWVLAYAWHPLLATEVAGSGHVDIVGALLLLVSAAALTRRWREVAAVAFGLAIAVKVLPIVLLPLYWKRVRLRDGALAALVIGMLYIPFLGRGKMPTGSLGSYVQYFRFNDPVFAVLERVAAPRLIVGLAVLGGFLIAVWLRNRFSQTSSLAFAWPMTASLLCAPVVYPWYLLWMLPFLRSASTLPIMVWTVSIIPTYYVWHLRTLGRPWSVPGWILLLEYGPMAISAAILALWQLRRRAAPRCPRSESTKRAATSESGIP